MTTDHMTAAEETAAFALLLDDPRHELKTHSVPLSWTCTVLSYAGRLAACWL